MGPTPDAAALSRVRVAGLRPDGGENSYLQAQKADAVKDLSTVAVWVGRRSLYVECLSIHSLVVKSRHFWELAVAVAVARRLISLIRSTARRGAAAQIRSGRERVGGGGGLREIMRGRKHFLGANRPPVLASLSPVPQPSPQRERDLSSVVRLRLRNDKSGTTGRFDTIFPDAVRVQPLMGQTIHPTDRPPAHLIGPRMHDCTRKGAGPTPTRRRLGEKSAIEVWKSVLSSSREDSLSLSYSESVREGMEEGRERGKKEGRNEGRRRFSSCRFRIG